VVFGNGYVHKDVGPTAGVLADAFPLHRIVAIGLDEPPRPNVTVLPAGLVPRATLLRLVASAGVIVFPSFYEGFGLPVVEGLAYGRPVLVRRSPLWAEIAASSRLPGRLYEFDDVPSLVEGVGRLLAGLPAIALPSGVALPDGTAPATWRVCAQRMIDAVVERLDRPVLETWWNRDSTLRILEA
jgi:glycosyltransferase involved in cell wall biosynthesis